MTRSLPTLALLLASISATHYANAQCPAGELSVTMEIHTDDWGNETYWQLVPAGNACGTGVLLSGGNPALNCSSGGTQTSPSGGYANNAIIPVAAICLEEGVSYSIISIDSYGDGQAAFHVFVGGASVGVFQQAGGTNVYTFSVVMPPDLDLSVTQLTTSLFAEVGVATPVFGRISNLGAAAVTSLTLNYSIDGGAPVTQQLMGLNIPSGSAWEFQHATPFVPAATGPVTLAVWATDINGGVDAVPGNDQQQASILVKAAVPDRVADYLAEPPILVVVADDDEDLSTPRDLDFHPDPARNELWVINKDVAQSGGSTVRFFGAGEPDMTFLWQRDPNAWHFMSLPTAIAFGDNGNFSTSPGVFDANHNGELPFTGPTLWSADPDIYAQPLFGPLGSHLDMIHVTPNSQGIAHERWNRYWVVDGYNNDVVFHDFRSDHGPGQDYHGDAIIRRYAGMDIQRDPNDHIVSHCVLDKATGWLYVVDHGNQRVLRLNTATGTVAGTPTFGPWESYVEYSQMQGHVWEVVADQGLVQPSGIELSGSHLLVSDHANGDIVVYDLATASMPEIGRIATGAQGIMGIKVGPDGRLWYVNATTHSLVRIDPALGTSVSEARAPQPYTYPNPANDRLFVSNTDALPANLPVVLHDAAGRQVLTTTIGAIRTGMDVGALSAGSYLLRMGTAPAQRVVIVR